MSQDPLQAIIGRIARFNQTNDPAHILNPAAVSEADALARDGINDLNALMALGMFHWCRYRALPSGADAADLDAALVSYGRVLKGDPAALAARSSRTAVSRLGSHSTRTCSFREAARRRGADAGPRNVRSRHRGPTPHHRVPAG